MYKVNPDNQLYTIHTVCVGALSEACQCINNNTYTNAIIMHAGVRGGLQKLGLSVLDRTCATFPPGSELDTNVRARQLWTDFIGAGRPLMCGHCWNSTSSCSGNCFFCVTLCTFVFFGNGAAELLDGWKDSPKARNLNGSWVYRFCYT